MWLKVLQREGGFTLIELLVTIAVLALLFGIVTMTLSGVEDQAQTEVCAAEYHTVESAIHIYLAENPGVELTAGTETKISSGDGEFAENLRGTTVGLYSWTTTGDLTAGTCPAPAAAPPGPCGVPGP